MHLMQASYCLLYTSDKVYDRIQVANLEVADDNVTSYFVDALTDQVIQTLIDEKGYTETQAYKALYSGGLTIYSTQIFCRLLSCVE